MKEKQLVAVSYPRVSTEGQELKGTSLGGQIQQIEEFAASNGLNLIAHFPEVQSASTVSMRKILKALIKRCQDPGIGPKVDMLLVTNLDRFSREAFLSEATRRVLKKFGVRIVSIQESYLTPVVEPQNEDPLLKLEREIEARKRELEAEKERIRIMYRMNKGRARKAQGGGWWGHRPPYEYDVAQGELILNHDRARLIRHLRRLLQLWDHERGKRFFTWTDLMHYLNGANGLRNKDGSRGRKFPPPSDPSRRRVRRRYAPYRRQPATSWNFATTRRLALRVLRSMGQGTESIAS